MHSQEEHADARNSKLRKLEDDAYFLSVIPLQIRIKLVHFPVHCMGYDWFSCTPEPLVLVVGMQTLHSDVVFRVSCNNCLQ